MGVAQVAAIVVDEMLIGEPRCELKCEYVEGLLDVEWTIDYDGWFVGCWVLVGADTHLGSCRCAMEWKGICILHREGPQQEPAERGTASDVIGRSTRMLPLSHESGRRTVPGSRRHRNDFAFKSEHSCPWAKVVQRLYRTSAVNKHGGV